MGRIDEQLHWHVWLETPGDQARVTWTGIGSREWALEHLKVEVQSALEGWQIDREQAGWLDDEEWWFDKEDIKAGRIYLEQCQDAHCPELEGRVDRESEGGVAKRGAGEIMAADGRFFESLVEQVAESVPGGTRRIDLQEYLDRARFYLDPPLDMAEVHNLVATILEQSYAAKILTDNGWIITFQSDVHKRVTMGLHAEISKLLTKRTDQVRVFDNGGRTMDRYTVIIGHDVWIGSSRPQDPQGVGEYADHIEGDVETYIGQADLGREVPITEPLPAPVDAWVDSLLGGVQKQGADALGRPAQVVTDEIDRTAQRIRDTLTTGDAEGARRALETLRWWADQLDSVITRMEQAGPAAGQ